MVMRAFSVALPSGLYGGVCGGCIGVTTFSLELDEGMAIWATFDRRDVCLGFDDFLDVFGTIGLVVGGGGHSGAAIIQSCFLRPRDNPPVFCWFGKRFAKFCR
eukprot:scaffold67079_cov71-Cyclotella_meneghiniana.AAC.1